MPPSPQDIERVTRALGQRPAGWRPVTTGNQSHRRYVVQLLDGSFAFVKIAANEDAAAWVRDEHRIYVGVSGSFLPRLLGWDDDGEAPTLAIEDLSGLRQPPPWDQPAVDAVLGSLSDLAMSTPPRGTPPVAGMVGEEIQRCWTMIGEEPTPFLAIGMCSATWLDEALPALDAAAQGAPFGGDLLLHMDVRSDNLFLRDGHAVLFDWNWACVGNPAFDIAAWLPSLHAEGGPAPEAILPDDQGFAAALAGFFALHASMPAPAEFPGVRECSSRSCGPHCPGPPVRSGCALPVSCDRTVSWRRTRR